MPAIAASGTSGVRFVKDYHDHPAYIRAIAKNVMAEWTKIGETEAYSYYADHGSIRKADETVMMSDLFDYKTTQTEGGVSALSKITVREYDCQNHKSQPVKTTWYSDHMGSGAAGRRSGATGQLTTSAPGTATAALLAIACRL